MNTLAIQSTEDSPAVEYDITTNKFIISGDSRPENAGNFYKPIISWITELNNYLASNPSRLTNNDQFSFIFKYSYFNSTSAKYIAEIFSNLKTLIENGHSITIEWYYDERDEDMLESGKEFALLFNLNVQFISY